MHFDAGYPWCSPCEEHHRPPQCAINQDGEPLMSCGHRWADVEAPWHEHGCPDMFPENYPPQVSA